MNYMKNYNVNFIEKDLFVFSGNGNSYLWDKAETLCDFISAWDNQNICRTEFKSIWDKKNIYFLFIVHDDSIHIETRDNSFESIGKSDRVELFFRTDAGLNPYYCLEIDPTLRIMDFKAYANKEFDFNWNWPKTDLRVKSSIEENNFSVEISISIKSLIKLNLIKDGKMEVGIFRAKYIGQENSKYNPIWISWVNPNTEKPNFHTSTSFGILHLMQ